MNLKRQYTNEWIIHLLSHFSITNTDFHNIMQVFLCSLSYILGIFLSHIGNYFFHKSNFTKYKNTQQRIKEIENTC